MFLDKLPKILTKIEAENDPDQLTPIFNHHKKNLNSFGMSLKKMQDQDWEKSQREDFVKAREKFQTKE